MQISNKHTMAFTSKISPTTTLENILKSTIDTENLDSKRVVINSLEVLLNNGEDDEVKTWEEGNQLYASSDFCQDRHYIPDGTIKALGYVGRPTLNNLAYVYLCKKGMGYVNLHEKIKGEDKIAQNGKMKVINYISRNDNSLEDAAKYLDRQTKITNKEIAAELNNKIRDIGKQIFGESIKI
ncbi:MAG: hypothetical protein NC191_01660 [Muribaculaceae bacterium]|nr:hypothetical protein [Muribaculaceae bacterium]